MKLSDLIEVFKGHDKVLFKLTGIGETEYGTIEFKDAIDTIEALQQENEQLKEQINTAKIGWDTYKTYSEQLEQQTADLIAKKEELARRLIKQDNRNPAAGGGAKYKFR